MKSETAKWVRKAEEDWAGARKLAGEEPPLRDLVCFHCQRAAEKYLKAVVPKTHDLESLLDLLLPGDATLAGLRRTVASLARYAVDYQYPDMRATRRQMDAALRHADEVRRESRDRLGLA
jgi:HEPN domain-containing protein